MSLSTIVSCFKRRTTVNYLNQRSPYQTVTGTIRKVQSDPIKEMNEYMKKCVSIYSFPFSQWLFIRTRTPTRICYSYGTLGDEVSS